MTGVAGNNLKDFKFNGALIRAPVLRNKYKTVAQPTAKNSKALDELTLNEDVDDSPLKEGFVTQVDFPTNTNQQQANTIYSMAVVPGQESKLMM